MSVVAVIPARYASSRFPGKPLVGIAGKPMIQRIYEQIITCYDIDRVLIATDDERISEAVKAFGGNVVMTSPDCPSGTDRVAQAVSSLDADYIVNVQGDQVVLDLDALSRLINALKEGSSMATIATEILPHEIDDPNTVKVVCALNGNALYFSRSPIPYMRIPGHACMLKHIGIYGFSRQTLLRFTSLKPCPVEQTESLEQLRALENGIPIKVIRSNGQFHEINTPTDLERLLEQWRP
jgi:3-deoxy-manno-octulosonate cytidylyltransferase (CMP-KDO synthetase)